MAGTRRAPTRGPRVRAGRTRQRTPIPAVVRGGGQLPWGQARGVQVAAVAGCHGGAGASTLSVLCEPAVDLGVVRDWQRFDPGLPADMPLLLVTRGTAQGALAAVDAVAAASRIRPVRGVVVVGDGPYPEPREARARLSLLAGRVASLVRLPYVAAWRYCDEPDRHRLPAGVVRAVDEVRMLIEWGV
jgi:hypothetical protein